MLKMDVMVLKTQEYLNAMYGGDSRYNVISPVDGSTGWKTIYALTRALQIELGITSTADSFGSTSRQLFVSKYPNGVKQQADGDPTENNIYAIIQGALWCKGYSTGASGITKHFYGGTGGAVIKLKQDAGMINPTSDVTVDVMAALLSMNQYVTLYLQGGTDEIRTIQQSLNRKFQSYIGLAPCDGLYGREMNKALIIVLQAIEGLTPSQATGNFGDTTKAKCPILPDTSNKLTSKQIADATDLLRSALCCNGYSISLTSSGWDSVLVAKIKEFQQDMMLPVTGDADINTWMALLLSKGNPDRSATACDTRFEMTLDRITQLKDSGYQIVGRYLTGSTFKVLRADEPQRILDNGLWFFPIFQESTTDLSYFTSARGKLDVLKAVRAARNFRIPEGNVIFFAVDTDPQNAEIYSYILPYFKSLSENMDKSFKVGVYGTRNVCTKVCAAGYAVTSFVSDMSTGYSGNMGFKMPSNWTYDQFSEISVSPDWGIDKVTYSGKYLPVKSLNPETYKKPPKPSNAGMVSILSLLDKMRDLESLYKAYWVWREKVLGTNMPLNAQNAALGITNFLRAEKYRGTQWGLTTLRPIDDLFIQHVKDNDQALYDYLIPFLTGETNTLSDLSNGVLDFAHLAATTECYISSPLVPDFWTGWGGDLATAMADTTNSHNGNPNQSIEDIADSIVGSVSSSFNYSDMCSDADAIKIAGLVITSTETEHALSVALQTYYTTYAGSRYKYYVEDLECPENLTALKEAIHSKMTGKLETAPKAGLLASKGNNPSDVVITACCNSFAKYIYSEL